MSAFQGAGFLGPNQGGAFQGNTDSHRDALLAQGFVRFSVDLCLVKWEFTEKAVSQESSCVCATSGVAALLCAPVSSVKWEGG